MNDLCSHYCITSGYLPTYPTDAPLKFLPSSKTLDTRWPLYAVIFRSLETAVKIFMRISWRAGKK